MLPFISLDKLLDIQSRCRCFQMSCCSFAITVMVRKWSFYSEFVLYSPFPGFPPAASLSLHYQVVTNLIRLPSMHHTLTMGHQFSQLPQPYMATQEMNLNSFQPEIWQQPVCPKLLLLDCLTISRFCKKCQHSNQNDKNFRQVSDIGFIKVHELNEGHFAPDKDIEFQLRKCQIYTIINQTWFHRWMWVH